LRHHNVAGSATANAGAGVPRASAHGVAVPDGSYPVLVNGLPETKLEGRRPVLEIKLITGERLMFDSEGKRFSVG
jgi:hypothetical protein